MLNFEKYHGLGNDFIIFLESSLKELNITDYSTLALKVCHRNFGIGADGILIVKYVENIPFMLYYNSDGSKAPMCGNGIRCFAHYLKNNKLVEYNNFIIKTSSGDMYLETKIYNNNFIAKVNMGKPIFNIRKFINTSKETFINEKIIIDNKEITLSYIFVGTDHTVVFSNDLSYNLIDFLGPKIENYTDIFYKKTNVNFVKVIDRSNIEVVTWERGAGRTLACGTGATASAVLSAKLGKTNNNINVKIPGGILIVEYDSHAYMTGPSKIVAKGIFYL